MSKLPLIRALEQCKMFAGTHRKDLLKEKALEVLEISPSNEYAFYYLCLAYNDLREYENLKQITQSAITIYPLNPSFYYFTYLYYLAKGGDRYLDALKAIKEALRLNPHSATYYRELGEVYLINWEPEKACFALEEALRLSPDNSEIMSRLALSKLRCHKVDKAFKLANSSLSLSHGSYDVYNNVGQVFLFGGRLDEAEILFKEALSLFPTNEYFQKQLKNCIREKRVKESNSQKNRTYKPLVCKQKGKKRFFDEDQ